MIQAAGHHEGSGYSVQANIMVDAKVWGAMARAYEGTTGDLAERLLAALDGAQAAGGDLRGKWSAALLVVKGRTSGRPWLGGDRLFDVRVDDHPEPLVELRRLVHVQRAINRIARGDELMEQKKVKEALVEYREAAQLAPNIPELKFWYAVALVAAGMESEAVPLWRELFAKEPFWLQVVRGLPAAGILPNDPALLSRIEALTRPQ